MHLNKEYPKLDREYLKRVFGEENCSTCYFFRESYEEGAVMKCNHLIMNRNYYGYTACQYWKNGDFISIMNNAIKSEGSSNG